MKAAGAKAPNRIGRVVSLLVILLAIGAGIVALQRRAVRPETDDATIDADVVHVASQVGGRIIEIPVAENDRVAKGDLLFQIDPVPYRLAVAQTQADLDLAEAAAIGDHADRQMGAAGISQALGGSLQTALPDIIGDVPAAFVEQFLEAPERQAERPGDVVERAHAVGARMLVVESIELTLIDDCAEILILDDEDRRRQHERLDRVYQPFKVLDVGENVRKGDDVGLEAFRAKPSGKLRREECLLN